jgi:hypothetical protein
MQRSGPAPGQVASAADRSSFLEFRLITTRFAEVPVHVYACGPFDVTHEDKLRR